jgi:hypothetical protein
VAGSPFRLMNFTGRLEDGIERDVSFFLEAVLKTSSVMILIKRLICRPNILATDIPDKG